MRGRDEQRENVLFLSKCRRRLSEQNCEGQYPTNGELGSLAICHGRSSRLPGRGYVTKVSLTVLRMDGARDDGAASTRFLLRFAYSHQFVEASAAGAGAVSGMRLPLVHAATTAQSSSNSSKPFGRGTGRGLHGEAGTRGKIGDPFIVRSRPHPQGSVHGNGALHRRPSTGRRTARASPAPRPAAAAARRWRWILRRLPGSRAH